MCPGCVSAARILHTCRFAHEYLQRLDNYYVYRTNEGKVRLLLLLLCLDGRSPALDGPGRPWTAAHRPCAAPGLQ